MEIENVQDILKEANVEIKETHENKDNSINDVYDKLGKTLKALSDSGVTIDDLEALGRKDELLRSMSYIGLSKKDEADLRERAVRLGLVPPTYKTASFNKEQIKQNVINITKASKNKVKIYKYNEYTDICESIINTVRANKIPSSSYILGAPNGFGKQSFATDCIIASLHNGWITVPYISLIELAELKAVNDRVIERGLMGMETKTARQQFNFNTGEYDDIDEIESYYYAIGDKFTDIKQPTIITGRYTWSEYINAPILVCFFSGIESKVAESQILYTLLNIRSAKGYPTIALISTSLSMYTKDPVIGKYVWNEILNKDPNYGDLNRVTHISTFKSYDGDLL